MRARAVLRTEGQGPTSCPVPPEWCRGPCRQRRTDRRGSRSPATSRTRPITLAGASATLGREPSGLQLGWQRPPQQRTDLLVRLIDQFVDRHVAIAEPVLVELGHGTRDPDVDRRRWWWWSAVLLSERFEFFEVEQRRAAVRADRAVHSAAADVRVERRRRHPESACGLRSSNERGHDAEHRTRAVCDQR